MKRAVLLFILIDLMFCSSKLFAVSKISTNKISEVAIEGLKNVKDKTVRSSIISKKGKHYDEDKVKSDMKSILELGYFDNVEVSIDTATWKIVYKVREKPYIKKISFKGNKLFSQGRMKSESTLKEKEYYDISKLEETKSKIIALYHEKGYSDVKIEVFPTIDDTSNQMALSFVVTEGNRILVGGVSLEGVKAYKTKKIAGLMKIKKKKVYKEETIEKDRDEIEKFYKNNGYIQVEVGKPVITYNKERTQMFVVLNIKEGPKYKIGNISFSGNTVYTTSELNKTITMTKNKIYSEEKLHDSVQTVQEKYSDKGYLHARVNPEFTPDPDKGIMNINLAITENDLIYLGSLYIDGLTNTKEYVIRREVLLKEGDVFAASKIRRSLEKINNLGFIDSAEPELQPTNKRDVMDLVLNITEGKPGVLTAGAGYSSVDKLVGTLSLSHMNLFGRAEKLSVQYQFGATKNSWQLSWMEPWFMQKPVSLGVGLFNTQTAMPYLTNLTAYYQSRRGATVSLGPRLSDYLSLMFSYTLENISIYDVIPDTTVQTNVLATQGITSSVSSQVMWDTRDNIFDPSRGTRDSLSIQYAGGVMGGDINFIKTIGRSSWYFPTFWKFVLSVNMQAGRVEAFDSKTDVPVYQRFYVGGADTVRGYQYASQIGPANGGDLMAVGNVEYKFPIVQEKNHTILQGAFFYDIGGTWASASDVDFSIGTETNKLKSGVGFGIRFTTPVFPLRLDWGYGFNHNIGESLSQFYFTIGNIF